jgi:hypothetical protein
MSSPQGKEPVSSADPTTLDARSAITTPTRLTGFALFQAEQKRVLKAQAKALKIALAKIAIAKTEAKTEAKAKSKAKAKAKAEAEVARRASLSPQERQTEDVLKNTEVFKKAVFAACEEIQAKEGRVLELQYNTARKEAIVYLFIASLINHSRKNLQNPQGDEHTVWEQLSLPARVSRIVENMVSDKMSSNDRMQVADTICDYIATNMLSVSADEDEDEAGKLCRDAIIGDVEEAIHNGQKYENLNPSDLEAYVDAMEQKIYEIEESNNQLVTLSNDQHVTFATSTNLNDCYKEIGDLLMNNDVMSREKYFDNGCKIVSTMEEMGISLWGVSNEGMIDISFVNEIVKTLDLPKDQIALLEDQKPLLEDQKALLDDLEKLNAYQQELIELYAVNEDHASIDASLCIRCNKYLIRECVIAPRPAACKNVKCTHYKKGTCKFLHAPRDPNAPKECTNGPTCAYFKARTCKFAHSTK